MPKHLVQGTISFSVTNLPVTLELELPEPAPEPEPDVGWAYAILGTSTPCDGLDGPGLTLQAQQGVFDLPASLAGLPERTDLQAQLDAAQDVCELEPGIYRCSATIGHPLEVRGQQRVSIRASDDWSPGGTCEWTTSGGAWISSLRVPDWPPETLQPFEARDAWRAGRAWIVMLDGVRQYIEPTTGTVPSAGHFQLDNDRVILPLNPAGHLVEVSVRGGAGAWLNVTVDGVVLDGIDFRHAPSGLARWNALESNGRQITYRGCMFGWTHGYGPAPGGSRGSVSESCVYHNSGIGGLGGPNMHGLVLRNAVLFNNGFGEGWARENGSGGCKVISSNDVTFENTAAFHNNFAGLWTDIDCRTSSLLNNCCWDNGAMQIHYEISEDGSLVDNVVFRTEHFSTPQERTLGIYISSSRQVHVGHNLAMHLPSAYEIRWTERGDQPAGGCNGIVHEDCIAIGRYQPGTAAGDWGHDFGLAWLDSAGGVLIGDGSNVARNNRYGYPGPEPEDRWSDRDTWLDTLAKLQAVPQIGQGASYLSDSERLERLARFGLSE